MDTGEFAPLCPLDPEDPIDLALYCPALNHPVPAPDEQEILVSGPKRVVPIREVKSTDYQGCHKKLSWDVAQAREQYVQRRWKSKIGDLRRPSQAGHKPSRAQMIWVVLKIAALLLDNQDNPTRYIAPGRSNGRGSIAGCRQLQMWIFRWLARSQPALWKQRTLLQSKFHVHEHRRANMEIPKPLKRVTANWATGTVDANLDEMAAQCPQLVDSVRIQSGSPLDDCVSTIKEITKSKLASSVSVCVHRQWSGTWPPARRDSPDTCRWRLASAWKKLSVSFIPNRSMLDSARPGSHLSPRLTWI
ncbi:hypothetical protein B0H17DRAFT_1144830 [Mycena rosella]|uniref:Uncharacterized protein n=1 Tax=Mycena rosella TaxID=1033263 RepID=A0AAD7G699_MYCRO|nr:hypothetical protein B0H17DRAFT_1144830 [Mycena rosella]